MKKNIYYSILFLFFIFVFTVFYLGLDKPNFYTPNESKNKNFTTFTSKELFSNDEFNSNDIIENNNFTLLNVWASWCAACRIEHPILNNAVRNYDIKLYGLNYKDSRSEALIWLKDLGNPYIESAYDKDGVVGIDYGVYGVPETFIIDKQGIIRYKHIGPINNEQFDNIIMPMIRNLEEEK